MTKIKLVGNDKCENIVLLETYKDGLIYQYDCYMQGVLLKARIDTIKIKDGIWYIKSCKGWDVYFDKQKFQNKQDLILYDTDCKITKMIPIEEGNGVFIYRSEEQHYNYFAPKIYFHPKIGIVRIVSKTAPCEDSRILKIKELKLSSNQIALLIKDLESGDIGIIK